MSALVAWLGDAWWAVLVHLWQTTLLLGVLALISLGMRRAPGRAIHLLWSLGLLKLFVPLAVGGGVLRLLFPAGWTGSGAILLPVDLSAANMILREPPNLRSWILAGAWGDAFLLSITVLWGVVAVVLATRLVTDARATCRVAGSRGDSLESVARDKLLRVLSRAGIDVGRVLVCHTPIVPSVAGFFRPRILVPERLVRELSECELLAVLLHEDMHRRRREPLQALIHRVAFVLFFFYPLLAPLLRRLRESSEFACDEGAVQRGTRRAVLARALAHAVNASLHPVSMAPAAGSGGRSLLRRRFERLEAARRYPIMLRTRLLLTFAGLVVAAATFLPVEPASVDAAVHDAKGNGEQAAEPKDPDKMPVPIHTVHPKYPEEARKNKIEGRAVILAEVNEHGLVASASVESTEGHAAFGDAAREAVLEWRFRPGQRDGEPVAVMVKIPVRFALE